MGKIIGIDLGTTNSCVAVLEGDQPVIIHSSEGLRTTPSVVAFTRKGERLVGAPAKRQAAMNPQRTVASIKRRMGTDYRIDVDGHAFSPQEISAMILKKLKKDAEDYLGESVTDAVITVPAYFNDAQRQATKDAGRIAGLNVQRIINEPTAAAFAYGLSNAQAQKVLVYDLGGGTFDVSVIEIGDGLIEVLATAGDNMLGGDDFDDILADHLLDAFYREHHIDLSKDQTAMLRIMEEAEKAKIELSSASSVTVNLPFIAMRDDLPYHLQTTITRSQFDQMTQKLIERTASPVQTALKDAHLTAADLSKVLLVGGSTRIPAVQEKVRRMLGMEPSKSINPDECVAMGASIQAGKLGGMISSGSNASAMVLMDVTPLSLSIETVGGIATKLIGRNTTIPARYSQIFSTAANFQTSVDIKVYQGERQFVKDNVLLGNFRLTGIKRAFAGIPQIEVTFDIDVNGILTVAAKDLGTGKAQQITISSRSNMSEEEIRAAVEAARRFDEEDSVLKGYFEMHNEAQAAITEAEELLRNKTVNLDRGRVRQIKQAIGALKKSVIRMKPVEMTGEDAARLRSELDQLISLMV